MKSSDSDRRFAKVEQRMFNCDAVLRDVDLDFDLWRS